MSHRGIFSLILCLGLFTACHECDDLVQKMCTDLGPEDCAYWKAGGMDQKLIPGGRGVNKFCGMMKGDAVYQPLLKAQRDWVKAMRNADAVRAKTAK